MISALAPLLIVIALLGVGCSLLVSCVVAVDVMRLERREEWDRERDDLERQRRGPE